MVKKVEIGRYYLDCGELIICVKTTSSVGFPYPFVFKQISNSATNYTMQCKKSYLPNLKEVPKEELPIYLLRG